MGHDDTPSGPRPPLCVCGHRQAAHVPAALDPTDAGRCLADGCLCPRYHKEYRT